MLFAQSADSLYQRHQLMQHLLQQLPNQLKSHLLSLQLRQSKAPLQLSPQLRQNLKRRSQQSNLALLQKHRNPR
jgi:hypothetical protein